MTEEVHDSIAEKAAEALVETISNPTPAQVVKDIMLAVELLEELKEKLKGLDSNIVNIIKALF